MSRRPPLVVSSGLRSSEGVVEGLDRLSSRPRVENEASSFALVRDLDAKLVPAIPGIPKQIDDDSAALAVPEMVSPGWHCLSPPG
jgi:hypothetical protein